MTTTAAAATITTLFSSVHLLKCLTVMKPVRGKHCRKELP
jgi:hypothetical protein